MIIGFWGAGALRIDKNGPISDMYNFVLHGSRCYNSVSFPLSTDRVWVSMGRSGQLGHINLREADG